MSFVNRSGGEQKRQTQASSGAPPVDDFDPADPDTVKVHYDVSGWDIDQRGELSQAFAEAGVPHGWDGDELVVPEAAEAAADQLFEVLDRELGPFPVALPADQPATEFGLDDWPETDRQLLRRALIEAEIPHRWEGAAILVATDAEDVVDDLLDAIERGDIASYDEDGEGAPDGALGRLFSIGDRLARTPTDSGARRDLFALVEQLDGRTPPFGVAVRTWSSVVDQALVLVNDFEIAADDSDVIGHAQELRTITRPYV